MTTRGFGAVIKSLGLICLIGCVAPNHVDKNEFYHRFKVRPSITEFDMGGGIKFETVHNPYEVDIVIAVDCENEADKRLVKVDAGRDKSFYTKSRISHSCTVFEWTTGE